MSQNKDHQSQFYTGIESVTKAPLPKTSQILILVIFSFFIVAITWAYSSEIDIVSPTQGKAIPSNRIKLIQSPQLSMIEEILVREGQTVKQGDILIRLDDQQLNSEINEAEDQFAQLSAKKIRLQALLNAAQVENHAQLEDFKPIYENTSLLVNQIYFQLEEQLMHDQWMEYKSDLNALLKQVEAKSAAINKLEKLIPFSNKKVRRLEKLVNQRVLPRNELEDANEVLTERKASLVQAEAELAEVSQNVSTHTQRFISQLSSEFSQTQHQWDLAKEGLARQKNLLNQYTLVAPFDGTVMEITADTRAVVEPAETLMRVVPEDELLEVEIKILNRDIGFVSEGQPVKVKVDTFNFTKYGSIDGVISQVSQDAIEDEQLGFVYPALVKLNSNTLLIGDREAQLVPGMTVAVDIRIGERRLIEYILNPVLRYRDEVMRER